MPQNMTYGNPYASTNQMQTPNTMNGNVGFQNMGMSNNTRVQPSFLPGRMVVSEADIVPQEVPMDGTVGVFLQQDLSRVYAKKWGGDGRIYTNVYELANGADAQKGDPMALILERLDRIEESLKREKPQHSNPRPPKKSYRGNKDQNRQGEER